MANENFGSIMRGGVNYSGSGGGGSNNFVGTTEEWEELSTAEQNQYDTVDLTDDHEGDGVVNIPLTGITCDTSKVSLTSSTKNHFRKYGKVYDLYITLHTETTLNANTMYDAVQLPSDFSNVTCVALFTTPDGTTIGGNTILIVDGTVRIYPPFQIPSNKTVFVGATFIMP